MLETLMSAKATYYFSKFLPFLIFLIPFLQLIPAIYAQQFLINAAGPTSAFHQAAWRENYVMVMRQGMNGQWATSLPYSTTPPPPIFGFNLFFIILGQINRLFNLDMVFYLNLVQLNMGVFLFFVTYWAVIKLFPKSLALIVYFFTLGIETGVYLPLIKKTIAFWEPSFVAQQQLIHRHFGYPHHSFAKAIGLIYLVSFIKALKTPKPKFLITLTISGLIGGFVLPPFFVVLIASVFLPYALYLLWKKQLLMHLPVFVLAVLPVMLSSFFIKYSFSTNAALSHYTETEKTWWTTSDTLLRYGSSLLFFYPWILLGIIALIKSWKSLTKSVQTLGIFSILWLVGIVVLVLCSDYQWFPIANGRLTDGYQYFPAAVLSGIGIHAVLSRRNRLLKTVILSGLIITIVFSISTSTIFINNYLVKHSFPWSNIYPSKGFWKAIEFLGTVPKGSNVIAHPLTSETIVAYADVNVYVASPGLSWPHYDKRAANTQLFYSGTMSNDEAIAFLNDNNITYINYGFDETLYAETPTLYSEVLDTIFEADGSLILTLKPQFRKK